jgi:hypothetical protein
MQKGCNASTVLSCKTIKFKKVIRSNLSTAEQCQMVLSIWHNHKPWLNCTMLQVRSSIVRSFFSSKTTTKVWKPTRKQISFDSARECGNKTWDFVSSTNLCVEKKRMLLLLCRHLSFVQFFLQELAFISIKYTQRTELQCAIPKNLTPWWDSNSGSSVL